MKAGLLCVQMSVRDYQMFGEKNLKNYTLNMRMKEKEEELLKLDNCGRKLLTHKLKQVPHICYIKMHVIENRINKI